MSDPGIVMIVTVGFLATAGAIKAIAVAAIRYQENKLKYSATAADRVTEARLERMERALDSIAVEIERISEGQRFTTKLLAERSARAESQPSFTG